MIKVIEDLNLTKTKNIIRSINKASHHLNSIKENIQNFPEKYDLDTLINILSKIYDDIGDFQILVNTESAE